MNQVNQRGTFMTTKFAIPHLKKSANPHILIICPPPNMKPEFFGNHLPYAIAKLGMTMCVLGFSHEFINEGIAVNGLWPFTLCSTAAVDNVLGGTTLIQKSRKPVVVADAAWEILTCKSRSLTGNFFTDEDVLRATGVTDFAKYRVTPELDDKDLLMDGFLVPVRGGNGN